MNFEEAIQIARNYTKTQDVCDIYEEPKFGKIGMGRIGRNGIGDFTKEDFMDKYNSLVTEFPKHGQKIILTVPNECYYHIGLFSIENQISIASFCKQALYKEMAFVKKFKTAVRNINGVKYLIAVNLKSKNLNIVRLHLAGKEMDWVKKIQAEHNKKTMIARKVSELYRANKNGQQSLKFT